uniref:Uncharacterized protein n=1 Tax=Moniliophthora roreri TaxID=221103 RepID=A0A0W0FN67_MONRR
MPAKRLGGPGPKG